MTRAPAGGYSVTSSSRQRTSARLVIWKSSGVSTQPGNNGLNGQPANDEPHSCFSYKASFALTSPWELSTSIAKGTMRSGDRGLIIPGERKRTLSS
jgi:hypothetical protein